MLLLEDNSNVTEMMSNTHTILQQFWKTEINRNRAAVTITATDRSELIQIQHHCPLPVSH